MRRIAVDHGVVEHVRVVCAHDGNAHVVLWTVGVLAEDDVVLNGRVVHFGLQSESNAARAVDNGVALDHMAAVLALGVCSFHNHCGVIIIDTARFCR